MTALKRIQTIHVIAGYCVFHAGNPGNPFVIHITSRLKKSYRRSRRANPNVKSFADWEVGKHGCGKLTPAVQMRTWAYDKRNAAAFTVIQGELGATIERGHLPNQPNHRAVSVTAPTP